MPWGSRHVSAWAAVAVLLSGCASPDSSPAPDPGTKSNWEKQEYRNFTVAVDALQMQAVGFLVDVRGGPPPPLAGYSNWGIAPGLSLSFAPNVGEGFVYWTVSYYFYLDTKGEFQGEGTSWEGAFVPKGTRSLESNSGGGVFEPEPTYYYVGFVVAGTIPFVANLSFHYPALHGPTLGPWYANASMFVRGDPTHFDVTDPTHPNRTVLDVGAGTRNFGLIGFEAIPGPIEEGQEIKITHSTDCSERLVGASTGGSANYNLDPPATASTATNHLWLFGRCPDGQSLGNVHLDLAYRGTGDVRPLVFANTFDPGAKIIDALKSV